MTNLLGPGGQPQASIGLVIRSQVPHLVGMALDVLNTGLVVHELKVGNSPSQHYFSLELSTHWILYLSSYLPVCLSVAVSHLLSISLLLLASLSISLLQFASLSISLLRVASLSIGLNLSIWLSVSMPLSLSFCLYLCTCLSFVCRSISAYLSLFLPVCLSLSLYLSLSVCLSVSVYLFFSLSLPWSNSSHSLVLL